MTNNNENNNNNKYSSTFKFRIILSYRFGWSNRSSPIEWFQMEFANFILLYMLLYLLLLLLGLLHCVSILSILYHNQPFYYCVCVCVNIFCWLMTNDDHLVISAMVQLGVTITPLNSLLPITAKQLTKRNHYRQCLWKDWWILIQTETICTEPVDIWNISWRQICQISFDQT